VQLSADIHCKLISLWPASVSVRSR